MKITTMLRLCAIGAAMMLPWGAAQALIISDFTGDDIEMEFLFSNAAGGGVDISVGFTAASAETGDIRAVWLGLDDSLFDPSTILASDVTASAPQFGLINPASVDLGSGDNLNGGSGAFFNFDLDIAIQQELNPNQMLDSLLINIDTAGLMASYFNEAGARIRSSSGPEGSSKLLGGGTTTTTVSEPGTLWLLGAALLVFVAFRTRSWGPRVGGLAPSSRAVFA